MRHGQRCDGALQMLLVVLTVSAAPGGESGQVRQLVVRRPARKPDNDPFQSLHEQQEQEQ